jgi:hypothetical protein
MKIKKNTFSTLVLELFFPSIANCRKLKIQKNPKIDFPYYARGKSQPFCYLFKCQCSQHVMKLHWTSTKTTLFLLCPACVVFLELTPPPIPGFDSCNILYQQYFFIPLLFFEPFNPRYFLESLFRYILSPWHVYIFEIYIKRRIFLYLFVCRGPFWEKNCPLLCQT